MHNSIVDLDLPLYHEPLLQTTQKNTNGNHTNSTTISTQKRRKTMDKISNVLSQSSSTTTTTPQNRRRPIRSETATPKPHQHQNHVYLTCCSVLTSCVLCFTKPLPIEFRPRFGKRGHQKPSPIPFRLRFKYVDNRRQSKPLQQSSF
jgi:hypothetical protein